MKLSELPCLSFKALRQRLADQTPSGSPRSACRLLPEGRKNSGGEKRPMVVPTADSDFCHTAIESGWLTTEQMTHAAMHYRLGRSRSGKTIFWMIDEWGKVRDGRIGNAWASVMFRQRAPDLLKGIPTTHCLFGRQGGVHRGVGTECGGAQRSDAGVYLAGDDVPDEPERDVVRAITREMCDALPEDGSCG